jgi:cell wall-associated NlpC family hydrolase
MSSPFNKYLFIPFEPGGRDFDGCDCWGLVRLVFRCEGGIELPDWRIACTRARLIDERAQFERSKWRQIDQPAVLSVVAMRNCENDPQLINHFGVFVGNQRILHTARGFATARRTRLDDPLWAHKIEGFYVPKT